jgi:hypothetical protein
MESEQGALSLGVGGKGASHRRTLPYHGRQEDLERDFKSSKGYEMTFVNSPILKRSMATPVNTYTHAHIHTCTSIHIYTCMGP